MYTYSLTDQWIQQQHDRLLIVNHKRNLTDHSQADQSSRPQQKPPPPLLHQLHVRGVRTRTTGPRQNQEPSRGDGSHGCTSERTEEKQDGGEGEGGRLIQIRADYPPVGSGRISGSNTEQNNTSTCLCP